MRSTFKVLFYVKKGSEKPNGNLPLMCRITAVSYTHLSLTDGAPPRWKHPEERYDMAQHRPQADGRRR